jgi:hypothetical protein
MDIWIQPFIFLDGPVNQVVASVTYEIKKSEF